MALIRSCIEQQLNEIELLRCCYPSNEEFYLDDIEAIDQAKAFLNGQIDIVHRNISFILKLNLSDAQTNIQLQFIYPLHYPQSPVDIQLRTYFSRECYEKFNERIKKFLNEKIPAEEPYVMEVISWIQDNQDLFFVSKLTTCESTTKKTNYSRLWIYSHHIYNTEKRKNIVHWAEELHLNGFSLPGKPGIICIEGRESDVDEYWTRLRRLTWKRLQVKEKEIFDDENPRFNHFAELDFLLNNHGKGDFGQLYQYLQDKQLEKMFHLYFGFDGTDKK